MNMKMMVRDNFVHGDLHGGNILYSENDDHVTVLDAVKVQHPGVADSAFVDLDILWKVVNVSQSVIHMTLPFNRGEFDECIQGQMDFTREAFNLQKFQRNFKGERRIRFPKVSPQFVTSEVLIETWAEG